MVKRVGIVAVCMCVAGIGAIEMPRAHAQTAIASTPAFEVVSVKRNDAPSAPVALELRGGSTFRVTGLPLVALISIAYRDQQLLPWEQWGNIPQWILTERWDIAAKTSEVATPVQQVDMLRRVLSDRFALVTHRETREMPIYALTLARSDGKRGPNLRPAEAACAGGSAAGGSRESCGVKAATAGRVSAGGIPMTALAAILSQFAGRVVVDRTGLVGNYQIELTYMPEQRAMIANAPAPPPVSLDSSVPTMFTAVQEQLGLKLEAQKGPVTVLLVDSAQRPAND